MGCCCCPILNCGCWNWGLNWGLWVVVGAGILMAGLAAGVKAGCSMTDLGVVVGAGALAAAFSRVPKTWLPAKVGLTTRSWPRWSLGRRLLEGPVPRIDSAVLLRLPPSGPKVAG